MKGGVDIGKVIVDAFKIPIQFFSMAYDKGWLLYLIGGMIIFVVYVIFFA